MVDRFIELCVVEFQTPFSTDLHHLFDFESPMVIENIEKFFRLVEGSSPNLEPILRSLLRRDVFYRIMQKLTVTSFN